MHELSIACNLVEIAAGAAGNVRVQAVHVRLGALSGVVPEALLFSYDLAAAGTPLEGSRLIIEALPVIVHCPACDHTTTLDSIQAFRCAHCGAPTADIRQGKELDIVALEVADEQPAYP
jgi:hydrogenase nickel incorporation protein HypA/HybF